MRLNLKVLIYPALVCQMSMVRNTIFDYFVLGVCISSRDGYAPLYFRLDELVRTKQKYKILKMCFDLFALISILCRPMD